jgi:predicted unusual protein kinase regulating ubiquinone biosynthesis (AarF/ABC1/UbiB family)
LKASGISHLDLHPGNVMVSSDPAQALRVIDAEK